MSRPGRRDSIDFWRGLVLSFIFINHIPGNLFEILTPKNYGFSDSAEAFVFLSGVSLAFAYANRFADGRAAQVIQSLSWRVGKLYGIHIFLSIAAIAIFATGATLGQDDGLMNVHGRELFADDPWAALAGLLSLGHQLGYFNILPLYIVLIALLTVQLSIARIAGPWPMLAAAFALYAAARLFGWNIPTWPMRGTWFFNPLTWQFLMATGLASVILLRGVARPANPPLLVAAALVLFGGALSVTDGLSLLPGLQDWTRGWADLDKTSLGLGRLVHFAALAYLLYGLGVAAWFKKWPIYAPLCLLGRNSLTVFAILSLLAGVGQVFTTILGHTAALDMLLIGSGLAILLGAAWLSEAWSLPEAFDRARLRVGHR
ncbi:OpgC family protein [Lichenifustis flavocetrariae]|uniref:OpgC domain-containing protein n=1 Tax=Lichenifustis flavocetrariae TaxID=2949735 RepID=A0AA41Z157_9HYPH|nr:OpgC domain-containing protein [Lichenifustis flavocetrariae]MCW6508603.1 OpgC domain-containing protein [Lichenifustis flavocetrariae]